jgi:cell division protein FtsI (penicillin-binding protein 3)
MGNIIANVGIVREPEQGRDLILSLDHRIQYLAYRELQQAIEKNNAASGSIVVMDVKTGEILAMVNQPDYNPNDRATGRDGRNRNRAVTDLFEPGSTFKAFSVASGLVSTKYKPDTLINTNPGTMWVEGGLIKEVKNHNYGILSMADVLQHSSNVGVAKIVLSLPADNFWNLLRGLGFGERTASGFPGEASGSWVNYQHLPQFVLATMSFGYGLSVTALQLTQAYAVLAAGGLKHPVTFLKQEKMPVGEQVISPDIAKQIVGMLETVLQQGGTGQLAKVHGYRVAGKTGTAYIAAPYGGYYKDRYVSSFLGVAPVSDPRLVVAVVIQDPRGKEHYGGLVAAPAFSQVMSGALRVMNIPPDDVKNVAIH